MKTNIRSSEFCHLSSDQRWLSWLAGIRPDLYSDLYQHLRAGLDCKSNRIKMTEILGVLANGAEAEALVGFLRSTFPQVLADNSRLEAVPSDNKHGVFAHYDPTLLTFPRRQILGGSSDLDGIARDYCSDKAYCEHLVLEDRVYIEYLTLEFADLRDKIPMDNWQVRAFRRRKKM